MTADVAGVMAMLVVPAILLLGFLTLVALIVIGLADADAAEGPWVRRPGEGRPS